MLTLRDEFFDIAEHLDDVSKLSFTTTCTLLCEMRCKFVYDTDVYVCEIVHLSYFDQFKSVIAFMDAACPLPKNVVRLHVVERISDYCCNFHIGWLTASNDVTVPPTVTHLTIGSTWDQVTSAGIDVCIGGCRYSMEYVYFYIPDSVLYLEFGDFFNRTIQDIIPSFVTHLTFGSNFCASLDGMIPPSVTHLSVTDFVDISNISVSTLTIKDPFFDRLDNIHESVKTLIIKSDNNDYEISNDILSRVKLVRVTSKQ